MPKTIWERCKLIVFQAFQPRYGRIKLIEENKRIKALMVDNPCIQHETASMVYKEEVVGNNFFFLLLCADESAVAQRFQRIVTQIRDGQLEKLAFYRSTLGDERLSELLKELMRNTSVKAVSLKFCQVGPKGAHAFV